MNKQIKTLITLAILWLWVAIPAMAQQQYTLDMSSGTLAIKNINKVKVEGHSGNNVVFKLHNHRQEVSERARGLKAINSMGLDDNSGIGLSVVKSGGKAVVQQVSRRHDAEYTILVPKGVTVNIDHDNHYGSKIQVTKVTSEININTKHSSVLLAEVSGPLTVSTVHGSVDVIFSNLSQQAPVSIISTHGHIDVSLPSSAKANLQIATQHGDVYSDMSIDIQKGTNGGEGMRHHNATEIIGKINGGGVAVNLEARHGNVYLRSGK